MLQVTSNMNIDESQQRYSSTTSARGQSQYKILRVVSKNSNDFSPITSASSGKLKVAAETFEQVISNDSDFGSLLYKIKKAYDQYISQSTQQIGKQYSLNSKSYQNEILQMQKQKQSLSAALENSRQKIFDQNQILKRKNDQITMYGNEINILKQKHQKQMQSLVAIHTKQLQDKQNELEQSKKATIQAREALEKKQAVIDKSLQEIIDDSQLFDEPFSITQKKEDGEEEQGINNSLIFGEIESFTQDQKDSVNKIAIGGIDEVGKIKTTFKTPSKSLKLHHKMPQTLMSHLTQDDLDQQNVEEVKKDDRMHRKQVMQNSPCRDESITSFNVASNRNRPGEQDQTSNRIRQLSKNSLRKILKDLKFLVKTNIEMQNKIKNYRYQIDYSQQRQNKLMFLLYKLQTRGYPVHEVFEKQIKNIPTLRINKYIKQQEMEQQLQQQQQQQQQQHQQQQQQQKFYQQQRQQQQQPQNQSYQPPPYDASKNQNPLQNQTINTSITSCAVSVDLNASYEPIASGPPAMPNRPQFVPVLEFDKIGQNQLSQNYSNTNSFSQASQTQMHHHNKQNDNYLQNTQKQMEYLIQFYKNNNLISFSDSNSQPSAASSTGKQTQSLKQKQPHISSVGENQGKDQSRKLKSNFQNDNYHSNYQKSSQGRQNSSQLHQQQRQYQQQIQQKQLLMMQQKQQNFFQQEKLK